MDDAIGAGQLLDHGKFMLSPEHILQFGHDASVLYSRGMILKMDGFGVDSASTLQELEDYLSAKRYRLLVLCHSLFEEERRIGIELAAGFQPAMKVIALEAEVELVCPDTHVFRITEGPQRLRSAVQSLAGAA